MRIFSFLITLLLTIGFVQAKPKKCNKSKEQTSIVKPIILQDLSTNIHPADDFFEYVNAKWIQNNPIPSDKTSWGAFDLLQEKSTTAVKKIIDHATKSKAPKGSNLQILGDFFKSGMDTNAINKAGITPLLPYIEIINNAKDKQSIGKMLGLLQVRDINTPFGFYISQDAKNSEKYITYITQSGLGMPDKDYYLRTDEKSEKLKTAYKNYIQKIFELGGKNNIKQCVQDVWETELLLANASMSRVEQRDPIKTYNKFTIKELKNQYKNIDWDIMFNAMQFPKIDEIIVEQVDYLKTYDSLLQVIPQTQWQNYLYFQLVNSLSRYLSSNYVNARFDFYGKVLSGQVAMEPRWKRISNIANNYLRDVIGQEYVKENFSVSAKNRSLELIKNIKAALKDRIDQLTWMSPDTKLKAIEKLNKINTKIGYPEKWRSYEGLDIRKQAFVLNILNAIELENKRVIQQLGKPIDKTEWHMGPQTVNAYYNPLMNEIVFPAAILQAPFFYENADDAVNYGGIGMVIGHEITHGFDDQGAQFDANGNLNNWWTEEDAKNYKKLTEVFVSQYSNYYPIDSIPINGELTLGENIADLGGMIIALNALNKSLENKKMSLIDGLTPEQRFFLNYAIIWRDNTRPEALKQQLYTNEHTPAKYRVNVVLTNLQEFYDAFKVTPNHKMYIKEAERATMW
jgi:putative endopeptidase